MKISQKRINEMNTEDWMQILSCSAGFSLAAYKKDSAGELKKKENLAWNYITAESPNVSSVERKENDSALEKIVDCIIKEPQFYIVPGEMTLIRNDKQCQLIISRGGLLLPPTKRNEQIIRPITVSETLKPHISTLQYITGLRRKPTYATAMAFIMLNKPLPENFVRKECFMLSGRTYSAQDSGDVRFMPLFNRDGMNNIDMGILKE